MIQARFIAILVWSSVFFSGIPYPQPSSGVKTAPQDYKYYTMAIPRQKLLDWKGKDVQGVLFNMKHKDRLVAKDEFRLNAFVYWKDTVVGRLRLIETNHTLATDETKLFANYALSGAAFVQMIAEVEADTRIKFVLLKPEPEYEDVPTDTGKEKLAGILYNFLPADKNFDVLPDQNLMKNFDSFKLNPSPPKNPGFQ